MYSKVTQPIKSEKYVFADYAEILEKHQLNHKPANFYYQVGEPEKTQGWILHLSSIWIQIPELLSAVLPLLINHDIPFKVVQNRDRALALCDGGLGYNRLGKIFCIYPPNDEIAIKLVKELLIVTKDFEGGEIPTDFHLGGIIYTRYGSHNPVLYLNRTGGVERYIYDVKGQLIKDEYSSPFKFPKGIHWPFSEIAAPVEQMPSTFLNNCYKVFETLKTDAKGRVMKALRLHRFYVQWIVIKEAKKGVCVDRQGRDIQDRLLWQYDLLKSLENKIPVPKAYDFFKENDNSYLVMEYIKGKELGRVIEEVYELSAWFELEPDNKTLLVNYLLQLIDTIKILHEYGYVHRDINWVNFIYDKLGRFVSIDLELAYSMKENYPNPPFKLGTPGFLSPEQSAMKQPHFNQDIYSLGALMIKFFTNLNPVKFQHNASDLSENLNFFIRDVKTSRLIGACLSSNPDKRPHLDDIKTGLEELLKRLGASKQTPIKGKKYIKHLIERLIYTFNDTILVKPNRVWHSNSNREDEELANQQTGVTYDVGFYTGVSGIMYMLAVAKCEGFKIGKSAETYYKSWEYLRTNFMSNLSNMIPGLYHGAAGVALAIAKGIEAGLIDAENSSVIEKCFEIPATEDSVAHGVAGQGLAVLNCLKFIPQEKAKSLLDQYIQTLMKNQQKNGSWLTNFPESNRKVCFTGFSQGVAGICYFLLQHYDYFKDDQVKLTVTKALRWLKKKSRKSKEGTYWLNNNKTNTFDHWLKDGVAGVALCFINAYKVLGDQSYREIAERTLGFNPKHLVHPSFSFANGLVGIAEVYLIAYKVLNDKEWHDRTEFILNLLVNVHRGDEELCYWMVEDNKMPTADFMVGNSGILHFLIRYLSPQTSFFV